MQFHISLLYFSYTQCWVQGKLGPRQLGLGAQLSAAKHWKVGPQGPIVQGTIVCPKAVDSWAQLSKAQLLGAIKDGGSNVNYNWDWDG